MAKAHQKQSREQLREQKRLREISIERYQGKLALIRTYEDLGIDDDYTKQLRVELRKLRVLLENKGAL